MQRYFNPRLTIVIAVLGAGIIAVPAAIPPAPVHAHAVRLTGGENIAFIVGGSGRPIPEPAYVDFNNTYYVQPNFPGYSPQPLFTPEGNYGIYTGVKSLTLDQSEAQGVQIMDSAIHQQVDGHPDNHVAIYGQSQSTTIASMLMPQLHAEGVSPDQVGFVLVAAPNYPAGGFMERLDGLTVPSIGITLNGAIPDDLYPTTIYTQEYDGFADVPRYPINFLSDLNSVLGIKFVHSSYQDLTAEQIGSAIKLPAVGDTMTTYYMIPHDSLPLLDLVRAIPGVGKPLADLLQPILTPLVNLGYGDPDFGWQQGPANVPTEFGLFPSADMTLKALQEMAAGVPKGIQAAVHDLGSADLSPLPDADLSSIATAPNVADFNLTDIVNALTAAFSTAYAALLPTADVVTAATVTIPTYDVQWFLDGLEHGDLLSAIGQPIANDIYVYTLLAGFEAFALISTADAIGSELSGIIPD